MRRKCTPLFGTRLPNRPLRLKLLAQVPEQPFFRHKTMCRGSIEAIHNSARIADPQYETKQAEKRSGNRLMRIFAISGKWKLVVDGGTRVRRQEAGSSLQREKKIPQTLLQASYQASQYCEEDHRTLTGDIPGRKRVLTGTGNHNNSEEKCFLLFTNFEHLYTRYNVLERRSCQ